ncbi:MAG: hypothetical protein C0501_11945 [Isosphaera sp.]|nr:hypothetical protein [Isosphaera sp.]
MHRPPAAPTWDAAQLAVVSAPPAARLLVGAGPGTGKTAVACARVAALLARHLVPPANVLVLSFTRTAVAELRDRLAAAVGDDRRAAAVRLATLDAEAFRLNQGFGPDEASLLGGYEANVGAVAALLRSPGDEVADYLRRFRHLVVDEAQDLTGVRAALALGLVRHVRPECGVTVFADPGQAIYGFTSEDGRRNEAGADFLARLAGAGGPPFEAVSLATIHRTDSP